MRDVGTIRCVSLIGSHAHGKTTLAQAMVARYGKHVQHHLQCNLETISPAAAAADAAVGGTSQVRVHTLLKGEETEDSEDDMCSVRSGPSITKRSSGKLVVDKELDPTRRRSKDEQQKTKGAAGRQETAGSDLRDSSPHRGSRVARVSRTSIMVQPPFMVQPPSPPSRVQRSSMKPSANLQQGAGSAGGSRLSRQADSAADGRPQGQHRPRVSMGLMGPTVGLMGPTASDGKTQKPALRGSNARQSARVAAIQEGLEFLRRAHEKEKKEERVGPLLYLFDTPGHPDMAAEVATALRLTDAAVLVVDTFEGLHAHARDLLRQALHERARPALFCGCLDRCLAEPRFDAAEIEASLRATVAGVNDVISSIPDELLGDVLIRPECGLAIFGSAAQGWALSLPKLAVFFSAKFGIHVEDVAKELWVGMVEDSGSAVGSLGSMLIAAAAGGSPRRRISAQSSSPMINLPSLQVSCAPEGSLHLAPPAGQPAASRPRRDAVPMRIGAPTAASQRVKTSIFRALVLEPLVQLLRALMEGDVARAVPLLESFGASHAVPLLEEDGLVGEELVRNVMRRWCSIEDVLWEVCQTRLPSPIEAQKYRAEDMYRGVADDAAAQAVRACDHEGKFVGYVSRILPMAGDRSYSLGRLFSGTVHSGMEVKVRSFGEVHRSVGALHDRRGAPEHVQHNVVVERLAVLYGDSVALLPADFCVPCGNIVALCGPDMHMLKAGVICDPRLKVALASPHRVELVARVSVAPAQPGDLPRLIQALRRLSQTDPVAVCHAEEWGEYVVAGAGPHHIAACLATLRHEAGCPVKTSLPGGSTCGMAESCSAAFRETVCAASRVPARSETLDGAYSFEASAAPLGERLCQAMGSGSLDQLGPEERSRILADRYGWSPLEGLQLWCFGPQDCGLNAVINSSAAGARGDTLGGAPGVAATRLGAAVAALGPDSYTAAVQTACQWATSEGGWCEEPLRGVRFSLRGAASTPGVLLHGGGQAIGAARRCLKWAQLDAQPHLQEPWFWIEVFCRGDMSSLDVAAVRDTLAAKGVSISETPSPCGGRCLSSELPLIELLGLKAEFEVVSGGPDDHIMPPIASSQLARWSMPGVGDRVRFSAAFAGWRPLPESGDDAWRLGATVDALRHWRQLDTLSQNAVGHRPLSLSEVLDDDLADVIVRMPLSETISKMSW